MNHCLFEIYPIWRSSAVRGWMLDDARFGNASATDWRVLTKFGMVMHLGRHTPSHTHTHNHFTDFWTLSETTRVPEGTFCHLLDFLVQNEDNTGRHTNNPDVLPPYADWLVLPSLPSPPFLCRVSFLTQPSQFILAWDRHQMCWPAYPVAWSPQLTNFENF